MTSANAQRLHNLYVTQRLTAGEVHDVDRNPMSRKYADEVKTRVNQVVTRVTRVSVSNLSMTMPFVEWGLTKETYVSDVATWPENRFVFLPDLWAPYDCATVWNDCNTANNVIAPIREDKKNKETLAQAKAL